MLKRTAFLLALVLSLSIITPLSYPISTPVIVKFGNDESINNAVNILSNSLHEIYIVEYGTLEYFLIIWRAWGPVIWIGHGNKNGIAINDKIVTWKSFSAILDVTPTKTDILLSCYAGEIMKYRSDVITFGNILIESRIFAYLVSYILTGDTSFLYKAFEKAFEILNGEIPLFLYLGPWETTYWITMFFIVLISVMVGYWLNDLAEKIAWALLWEVKFAIIMNLVWYFQGHMDLWTAVSGIVGPIISAVDDIAGAAWNWINSKPWWERAFWIAVIIGGFIANLIPGVLPAKVVGVIAAFGGWALGLIGDYLDPNDDVG